MPKIFFQPEPLLAAPMTTSINTTPADSRISIGRMNWLKLVLGSERSGWRLAKPGSAEYLYYTDRSGDEKTRLIA